MNTKIIALVAIVIVIVAAAVLLVSTPNEPVACTMEAKICPDGTAVGRTGPNCEFAPCPNGTGIPNPASVYCEQQGGTTVNVDTPVGQQGYCDLAEGVSCDEWAFFRSNGRNCTYPSGFEREYTAHDPFCELRVICGPGRVPFSDETGCGCEPVIGSPGGGTGMANLASVYCEQQGGTPEIVDTPEGQLGMCHLNGQVCEEWALFRSGGTNCTDADGTPAKTYCTAEQREGDEPKICTLEYMPVCGWFNSSIQCFAYPCAQTYGNKCQACADPTVEYWTQGECPAVGSA